MNRNPEFKMYRASFSRLLSNVQGKPRTMPAMVVIAALGFLLNGAALATESDESKKVLQQEVEACMTSGLAVTYRIADVPGKPLSEKATPEEEAEIRKILEAGNRSFDPVRHRTAYLLVLKALRTKQIMKFTIESESDSGNLAATRACLAEVAKSRGMEFEVVTQ